MESVAVGELYERHWQPVYAFLRHRLTGVPDADIQDLTATVFERVVRFSARYQEQGQMKSWLLKLAQHVLIDRYRRLAVRPVEVEMVGDALGRATTDAGSIRHTLMLDLAAAVSRLPILQRVAIVEAYWMRAPTAETARMMGVSVESVRKLRFRAIHRLRREFAQTATTMMEGN